MNAYLYCYNDAVNLFDASGAAPESIRNNTTVDAGDGGSYAVRSAKEQAEQARKNAARLATKPTNRERMLLDNPEEAAKLRNMEYYREMPNKEAAVNKYRQNNIYGPTPPSANNKYVCDSSSIVEPTPGPGSIPSLYPEPGPAPYPILSVPLYGEPNTYVDRGNGQWRFYGPDGRALEDYDQPHHGKDWHKHKWKWNDDKPEREKVHSENERTENEKSLENNSAPDYALGSVIVVVSGIALILLIGDDLSGGGILDDVLIPFAVEGIRYGLEIVGIGG